jgi:uncharacterized protein YegL
MSRRLPIYFLIDVSESMIGEPLQLVEEGMAAIIKELKTDPHAIETAWISVIVFAGKAKTLVPLQEIIHFYPPKFPVGGGTSLSRGLGHLMFEMRQNIVKTTYEQKGDWKPIVFLFTDGVPTDDTRAAIAEWKQNWQRTTNLVAVSFGDDADVHALSELTENVLRFKNTDIGAYKKFFKWVTDSIRTSSISVENNAKSFQLVRPDGETLSKIDLTKTKPEALQVDNNFVVLSAKCQNSKRPYLIKYRKSLTDSGIADYKTLSYRLVGAYPVDQAYYDLSNETGNKQKINTEELIGGPTCPSCGNQFGLAMCACEGIHCIGDEEMSTCPWCGNTGRYLSGEGGFDVGRAQG